MDCYKTSNLLEVVFTLTFRVFMMQINIWLSFEIQHIKICQIVFQKKQTDIISKKQIEVIKVRDFYLFIAKCPL